MDPDVAAHFRLEQDPDECFLIGCGRPASVYLREPKHGWPGCVVFALCFEHYAGFDNPEQKDGVVRISRDEFIVRQVMDQ